MTTYSSATNPYSVYGHLTVSAVYGDGRRQVLSDRKNQIVSGFLATVAELLTQTPQTLSSVHERAIHAMWIEASDTAFLAGVTSQDTGPEGAIAKYFVFDRNSDVDVNVDGTAGLVEFRATVDKSECNGLKIRAAGLYTRGDSDDPSTSSGVRLMARQLFGVIEKQPQFALEFSWRIQLSIKTDSEDSDAGDY